MDIVLSKSFATTAEAAVCAVINAFGRLIVPQLADIAVVSRRSLVT